MANTLTDFTLVDLYLEIILKIKLQPILLTL